PLGISLRRQFPTPQLPIPNQRPTPQRPKLPSHEREMPKRSFAFLRLGVWEFRLGRSFQRPTPQRPKLPSHEREMPKPSFAFLRLGVLGVPPWAFISTPNATTPKTSKSRTRNAQAKLRLP